jgi:hypothetical protein
MGTMSVVGAVYKTKGEAEIAMKADKSCVTLEPIDVGLPLPACANDNKRSETRVAKC